MLKLLHIGLPIGNSSRLPGLLQRVGCIPKESVEYQAGGKAQFLPDTNAKEAWKRSMFEWQDFDFGLKQNVGLDRVFVNPETSPKFILGKGRKHSIYSPDEPYEFRIPRVPGNVEIRLVSNNPSEHSRLFHQVFGEWRQDSPKIKFTPYKYPIDFGYVHYKFALSSDFDKVQKSIPSDWKLIGPIPFSPAPGVNILMLIVKDHHGYEWVLTKAA